MRVRRHSGAILAFVTSCYFSPLVIAENVPYLVKDINPNGSSSPWFLTRVGDRLFFNAEDGVHGQELWVSDGTAVGTYMVIDLVPGPDGSVPQQIVELNGKALFQVDDNVDGMQWYISDGTAEGTVSVGNVETGGPGIGFGTCGYWGIEAATVGKLTFFEGDDPTYGKELWKTDGTPGGTQLVKDLHVGPSDGGIQTLRRVGKLLYFASDEGGPLLGNNPWRSDGTAAGTIVLADLTGAISFAAVNGTAFFRGEDSQTGEELWVSDGTPEGTRLVKDINPGNNPSSPFDLVDVDGILYFRAFSPGNSREIWRSDGTEEGTYMVVDLNPAGSSGASMLTNVDGTLFFRRNAETEWQIWKSDGTATGTFLVKTIGPDTAEETDWLTAVNAKLYFAGDDSVHGQELWVTDGTSEGTFMIGDTDPGPEGMHPSYLTPVGTRVFFTGGRQDTGVELWAFETQPPIPASSFWGLILLALGICISAIILHRRQISSFERRES